MEKPEWISWDSIHEVIWEAHAENRAKGIVMLFPSLAGDEIREKVEGKGKMIVALEGDTLVGTAAIIYRNQSLWCGGGKYAHCCFDAVCPEYKGRGIYKRLCLYREEIARADGVSRMSLDTHERNKREIDMVLRNGFIKVSYKNCKDHFNVMFVKWLDGCPYSRIWCAVRYYWRKLLVRSKRILLGR
jgi:GNAT superfamily N-acetyltransferase